jgi:uncharacterized protein (DUF2147 family)
MKFKMNLSMKPKLLLVIFLLFFVARSVAQTKADDIVGVWLTGGKEPAKIQIYRSGDKYYGKIVWLKYPEANGMARLDSKNPDKSKQKQQIIGLVILQHFRFDDNEWNDGKIYDPESGKTYSCHLTLKGNKTLKVRGYVGVSLLGRTETWIRTTL